jgi:hypothetical protein
MFGMGSFFETPPESPWASIGAPSFYYLPRFREMNKAHKFGRTPLDTLREVVTDSYFRRLPTDTAAHEAAIRKARTAAWSLTYFLAQQKLAGLLRYFTELSKMPRDMELDDDVLLAAFARSFDCVDANKQIDTGKLRALAEQWDRFITVSRLESENVLEEIRKYYKDMTSKPASGQNRSTQPEGGGGRINP